MVQKETAMALVQMTANSQVRLQLPLLKPAGSSPERKISALPFSLRVARLYQKAYWINRMNGQKLNRKS
jgi:hypothetical protein